MVDARHELRRQQEDQIQMDAEVAAAFQASQSVAGK